MDDSPYKFLEPYGPADRELFFGREREARVLVADVAVSRLVVLFAKTGTGKTSLINAGVRPRLHDRDFATYFIRVRRDPYASAREVLERDEAVGPLGEAPFIDQLRTLVKRLGKRPVVLFFDQFEEFFLYGPDDPAKMERFIADVAEVYRDEALGVQFVFSMREEFFAEMDAFRDKIPTIFHNESNLRLRWFTEKQARDAIVKPAGTRGVTVEDELVDRLIQDLAEGGMTEPIRLQIIFHALWPLREDNRITLAHYEGLGGHNPIIKGFLGRQLQEEFGGLGEEELEVLALLIPLLRSRKGTKEILNLANLDSLTEKPSNLLQSLAAHFESSRLINRTILREGTTFIELSHDYLVGQLEALERGVKEIWPRRIYEDAFRHYKESLQGFQGKEFAETRALQRSLPKEQFAVITENRGIFELDRDHLEILFRGALFHGLHERVWFDLADAAEVEVWRILEEAIEDERASPKAPEDQWLREKLPRQARNAVGLVADLQTPEAFTLLERVLDRTALAQYALRTFKPRETMESVRFLKRALESAELVPLAQLHLLRLASSEEATEVTAAASAVFKELAEWQLPSSGQDKFDLQLMSSLNDVSVIPREGKNLIIVAAVNNLLHFRIFDDNGKRILDTDENRLTEQARQIEDLRKQLESLWPPHELTKSDKDLVTSIVNHIWQDITQDITRQREELESLEREREQRRMPTVHFGGLGEDVGRHCEVVIYGILGGRVIPFLGPGINFCGRPTEVVKWSPGNRFLPSDWELAEYLAREFGYPLAPGEHDLLRVSQYVTITDGAGPLYEELHKLFDTDYTPTCLHRFLAALPSAMRAKGLPVKYPLIVTTNYDDVLEVAFQQVGEPYDVVYYETKGENLGKFWHQPPDGKPRLIERPNKYCGLSFDQRTIVLKIRGAVTRNEPTGDCDSYVIAEDHYIDYMPNTEVTALLPIPLPEKLRHSHCLFLGYRLSDWNLRIFLRRIWKDQPLDWKSWAIMRDSDAIDEQFWKRRHVDIINADLQDYIAALGRCLENWPHAGGEA